MCVCVCVYIYMYMYITNFFSGFFLFASFCIAANTTCLTSFNTFFCSTLSISVLLVPVKTR